MKRTVVLKRGFGLLVAATLVFSARAEDNTLRIIDGVATNLGGLLVIGATGTNNGVIITNGGIVTQTNAIVGATPGADQNFVIVTGSGSGWRNDGGLVVGQRGAHNALVISNGASATVLQSVVVGAYEFSSNNAIVVTDPGSLLASSGSVGIGGGGSQAWLVVTNGARSESYEYSVGSMALVAGQGSRLEADSVKVGTYKAPKLLILGGGQVSCRVAWIGYSSTGQGAAVEVSGLDSALSITSSLEMAHPEGSLAILRGGRVECAAAHVVDQKILVQDADSVWLVRSSLWFQESFGRTNQLTLERGGTLAVTNAAGDAVVQLSDLRLRLEGGNLIADRLLTTNTPSALSLKHGLIRFREARLIHVREEPILGDETGAGPLEIQGGNLVITNNLTLLSNVVLAASGELGGHLTNRGVLRPGNPVGVLGVGRFGGNLYNQGTVAVELAGAREGLEYGSLIVSNRARLGGRLEVTLAAGFRPAWTNQFSVLRWRSYEGAFTNAPPGARLSAGPGAFRAAYTPTGLVLTAYLADADGDGIDDLWARTYFGHSPLSPEEKSRDTDGDGLSNQAEFIAGTDPTDPRSVFRVLAVTPQGGGVRLRFPFVLGKQYRLWFSRDLAGWHEINGLSLAQPEPGVAEWVDDGTQTGAVAPGPGPRFYRLGVE